VNWIKRWRRYRARSILAHELGTFDAELTFHRDRIAELEHDVADRDALIELLNAEVAHQRDTASGAVRSRLEAKLLESWVRIEAALDTEPETNEDGRPVCTKIPLHSKNEAMRFLARIRRESGYPEQLEEYRCPICKRHPVVGRVRHLRHADEAGQRQLRGLTSTQRAEIRTREPLTQPIPYELLEKVRAELDARAAVVSGASAEESA
jgi:uncharacterized coiled-coil protein SlyX